MRILKLFLLALFVVVNPLSAADGISDLVQAIQESPADTAALVEEAVRTSPDQAQTIVNRLLATFPELAEEIVFGAIQGLPAPVSEQVLERLIVESVLFRPGLAGEIVLGARRATTAEMDPIITAAARTALQAAVAQGGPGAIGRTRAAATPAINHNPTLRIISPSN